jgi:hypothetical protein
MTALVAVSRKEPLREHLMVLREYARQVLVGGEALGSRTDRDWRRRLAEFLAIGTSFHLTDREPVRLVYRGLFAAKPQRGCSAGRAGFDSPLAWVCPIRHVRCCHGGRPPVHLQAHLW